MRIDYPRRGTTGVRRWLPSWRQLLSVAAARRRLGSSAMFFFLSGAPRCPSPTTSPPRRPRSSTGTTARPSSAASATPTASACRSRRCRSTPQHAVLAAEDRDFYEHGGFSPTGIGRADLEQRLGRRPAGRVDDHPAVREERVPHPGAHALAQGAGADPRGQARDAVSQGPDPRGLPQHHLLRPRRLRHPGRRRRQYFGKSVERPHPRRVRGARRDHPLARRLRPAPTTATSTGSRAAGTTSSTAWSTKGWITQAQTRRRDVPDVQEAQARQPVRRAPTATCSTRCAARSPPRASPRTRSTAAGSASSRRSTRRPAARRSRP